MNIFKVLPLRLASQRFPNKALCTIFDTTLFENALRISDSIGHGETIVTSSQDDFQVVRRKTSVDQYAFRFIPSSKECKSATERILEIHDKLDGDLYISIPIDEALLDPDELSRIIELTENEPFDVLTLYCDFFSMEDALSNLSAKMVVNNRNETMYMSRAVIPVDKNGKIMLKKLKKNVGVFFFTRGFLHKLAGLNNIASSLDTFEGLEQLRWIELGFNLKAKKIEHYGIGIDVPDQIRILEERRCLLKQTK